MEIKTDKQMRDENGKITTTFVDSSTVLELVYSTASVIGFRLSESNGKQGAELTESAYQFRMSSIQARKFAARLIEVADEIDGIGKRRQ